jgi:lmo0469 protein
LNSKKNYEIKDRNMEINKNKVLLILGNGLDLYMKLSSRYDDFIRKHRYNHYDLTFYLRKSVEKDFENLDYEISNYKSIIEKLNEEENIINNSLFLLYLLFCDNLKIENDNIWWNDVEVRLLSYLIEIRDILNELEEENEKIISSRLNLPKQDKEDFQKIEEIIKNYYKEYKISIPDEIEENAKVIKRYFIKELLKREYKIYNFLNQNNILENLDNEIQKTEKSDQKKFDEEIEKIKENLLKNIFENKKLENLINEINKKFKTTEKMAVISKIYEIDNIIKHKGIPYSYDKDNYKNIIKSHKKIVKLIERNYQELEHIFCEIDTFIAKSYYITSEKVRNLKNIKEKLLEYSRKRDLMKELKKFEKKFGEYINKEQQKIKEIVSLDNFYDELKYYKISKFPFDEERKKENNEKISELKEKIELIFNLKYEYTIINFNYSDYLDEDKLRENLKINQMINIHGTYEEPIFGMDNKSVKIIKILSDKEYNYNYEIEKNKGELKKFIKSSRVIGERKITNFELPKINNLKMICFFGHSLSEADYSYFQALFDYYEIYSSDVKLIFLFNNFKNTQREEQNFGIIKLLETYGKSMENKDKGKNLYYKLILENRIKLFSLEEWNEEKINF